MILSKTSDVVSKMLFLALGLSTTVLAGNNGRYSIPRRTSDGRSWNNFTGSGATDAIVRDVVILGGGATGTFAALKLKDANKTVMVVERKGRLGGHTETYHDPLTGGTVDCGVSTYEALPIVNETFGRYNISLTTINLDESPFIPLYADFSTGIPLNISTTAASIQDEELALEQYYEIIANFPYLAYGFDIPYPVPTDLLITFYEFIEKYSLQAAVPIITQFCQGVGNILNLPMIYVFKYFSAGLIGDLSTGFLTTTAGDNSLLYEAATVELGSNVLFNTEILSIDRSNPEYIELVVSTPTSIQTILAKQLVSTIPPVLNNLEFFDLDEEEIGIFEQFQGKGYYTALIRNIGLSDAALVSNVNPSTPLNIATLPSSYLTQPVGFGNLTHVYYGSENILTSFKVQSNIISEITKLKQNDAAAVSGNGNVSVSHQEPEFVFFSAHSPFELTVGVDAIEGGFYRNLSALQGKKNTWWTGAAFHTHSSGPLWRFTEGIVEAVLAGN